ncbi:MAG: hypothetical protein WEF53_01460 [Bacteroidota bacterium]
MRIVKRIALTIITQSLLIPFAHSQAISYLHTIVVGSEGTGTARAPDAGDNLEDLERNLIRQVSLRPKTQLIIRSDEQRRDSHFKRVGGLYASADSSDLVIGVCQGAWVVGGKDSTLSILSGIGPDTVTADYLVHLMRFLPVHNAALFVLAPTQFEFPRTALAATPTGISGGGKYLIVVRQKGEWDFAELVDRFADVMDSDFDGTAVDSNADHYLSFTEWLGAVTRRAAAAGLSGTIHAMSAGPDLFIKQLQ